jgi:hypothetical protein
MVAERRAAADDLAAAHQSAHQSAYLRNLAAADELRAVAAGRRPREDRARLRQNGGCSTSVQGRRSWLPCVNTNTPCPPTSPMPASQKMANPPPGTGAGSTPPPSPGDRQPWALRPYRRGRLRRPVAVGSITDVQAVYTPLVYQFCLFLLRTQICKICLILMKSSKFNENFANIKFQFFLGPVFWGRRCGSLAPKFWEGDTSQTYL